MYLHIQFPLHSLATAKAQPVYSSLYVCVYVFSYLQSTEGVHKPVCRWELVLWSWWNKCGATL